MRKLIYIISLLVIIIISSCYKDTGTINNDASLPTDFKFLELKLKVITTIINTNKNTTTVLYGNDLAFKKSALQNTIPAAGEKYVLVTWSQQPNPDWYGGKIPYKLLSVDVVDILSTDNGGAKTDYKRYIGKDLKLSEDTLGKAKQIDFILDQKQAILPQ
ncbi:hypothetical protein [Flavobacterium sp. 3-210]